MYFAEYDINGAPWIQLAASLRQPTAGTDERAVRFWSGLRGWLRNVGAIPEAGTSFRVRLAEDLRSAIFVVAPRGAAVELREAAGRLTQLELLADVDIALAQAREEHDALLRFPTLRCRAVLPALGDGQAWFAFDFRVRRHLDELLGEAHTLGHALSYHVNMQRFAIASAWQKAAAVNALRVAEQPGVGTALVQLQNRLAQNLRHATHVCEEYLGVETQAACTWLRRTLEQRFQSSYGSRIQPEFEFLEETHEAQLVTTRHSVCFESPELNELCAGAVTADDGIDLLAWQPEPYLSGLMPQVPATKDGWPSVADHSGMPPVYDGNGPFVFVSYSHADLHTIKPLVAELSASGCRIWYDRGIPGGAEWDAVIEERLRHSAALLLFVSSSAVQSKFVRREVKFADSLNKPIVSVLVEDGVELTHGFDMLLTQYQMLSAGANAGEVARAVQGVQLQRSR